MIDGRGWTPVCLPVFKTGVNGAEPFGWVRLPHALAKQRASVFTGARCTQLKERPFGKACRPASYMGTSFMAYDKIRIRFLLRVNPDFINLWESSEIVM